MGCRIRQVFSWLLLLGAIVLGVLLGLGVFNPTEARATIQQLEETPGQIVYQSRQSLKDQNRHSWQTIAFKRIRPNGETSFELRLVGFPGMIEIDHTQPLTLINSLGKTLTAIDDSSKIFSESVQPAPNVSQYNLQPLLSELQVGIPLKLTIPVLQGEAVSLLVPPWLVEEWQAVANRE